MRHAVAVLRDLFLNCQRRRVAFEAAATAIRFEAGLLQAPVVQDEAALKAFLRAAPQSVFLKYRNEDGWAARVRRRLRAAAEGPADWPDFAALAAELGVAETTLRRRLEGEGTSYQAIKDRLRNDAAIDCLCHSALSIDEIAARLGFLETSAFHRAFKRWNGLPPGAYRRMSKSATQAALSGIEKRPQAA